MFYITKRLASFSFFVQKTNHIWCERGIFRQISTEFVVTGFLNRVHVLSFLWSNSLTVIITWSKHFEGRLEFVWYFVFTFDWFHYLYRRHKGDPVCNAYLTCHGTTCKSINDTFTHILTTKQSLQSRQNDSWYWAIYFQDLSACLI